MGRGNRQQQAIAPAQKRELLDGLKAFLNKHSDGLKSWCRPKGVAPDTLIRCAVLAANRSDDLLSERVWGTTFLSLVTAARLDLEPNGPMSDGYLVVRGGECRFEPGYRGLIKLAVRSGMVQSLRGFPVYERDDFEIQLGTEPGVKHRVALTDRGQPIGAYAIARLTNGTEEYDWMPWEEIERARQMSRSPAWNAWPGEMARKTPIKRISKQLPLGRDYALAVAVDDADDADEVRDLLRHEGEGRIIDVEASEVASESGRESRGGKLASKIRGRRKAEEPEPVEAEEAQEEAEDDVPDFPLCPDCATPVEAAGRCASCLQS